MPTVMSSAAARRQNTHHQAASAGWAFSLTVRSFEIPLTVHVSHLALARDVVEQLPPGAVPAQPAADDRVFSVRALRLKEGDDASIDVYEAATRIASTTSRAAAMLALESALRFAVASSSDRWLFVHAGVVAWRGRAIVIPGVSGSGKTTLVKALVDAGATYFSDEYAVIGEDGLVHPFPKPLLVRQASPAGRVRVPVTDLRAPIGDRPLPIGVVVATEFHPGACWTPRSLTAGETMMAMLANTVRIRMDPSGALQRLSHAIRRARGMEGRRDGVRDVVASLLHIRMPDY